MEDSGATRSPEPAPSPRGSCCSEAAATAVAMLPHRKADAQE